MRQIIPLLAGAINSHSIFTIQLGDNLLEFTLNYVGLAGPAWSLDMSREGVLLAAGMMLEPGAVITQPYELDDSIGRLVFTGLDVTIDNLGIDNQLVWVSNDE